MPFGDETFDFVLVGLHSRISVDRNVACKRLSRAEARGQALIIDLRRDASRESIAHAVDAMKLGAVNRVITKMTFRFMLLKRAYTKSEFKELIAETKFQSIEIRDDLIGLEIWLTKNREAS